MPEPDTEQLLDRAAAGEAGARGLLLQRHRERLKRMVAVRADPRLAGRVDQSDVVQETLAAAAAQLDDYLHRRPIPFYPWLRRLAQDQLADLHRRHVRALRRSVVREEGAAGLPDRSALELADRLLARESSPSAGARRSEDRARVRAALAALPEADREVLVLRVLEEMPTREIAATLGITEGAVRSRQVRALYRLRAALGSELSGGG
jgi:RNA polymerase sigma-70 factor (ECF subfamily)